MRIILIQLRTFTEKWNRLGLTDDDLRLLEQQLIGRPESGDLIPGTGGLRKIRFAPTSWHSGKRGATRVIYAFFLSADRVYLFTLYGKNEQTDISAAEKSIFRRVLEQLRKSQPKERSP